MKKIKNGYYVSNHSCFVLQFHLVLITKYRHKVIKDNLKEDLLNYIKDYFKKNNLEILELNSDLDHIHILFESGPNINLSILANNLKSASSKYIRNRYKEELKPYYWKPYFWSKSYFIATVSERNTEIVKEYIKNQRK